MLLHSPFGARPSRFCPWTSVWSFVWWSSAGVTPRENPRFYTKFQVIAVHTHKYKGFGLSFRFVEQPGIWRVSSDRPRKNVLIRWSSEVASGVAGDCVCACVSVRRFWGPWPRLAGFGQFFKVSWMFCDKVANNLWRSEATWSSTTLENRKPYLDWRISEELQQSCCAWVGSKSSFDRLTSSANNAKKLCKFEPVHATYALSTLSRINTVKEWSWSHEKGSALTACQRYRHRTAGPEVRVRVTIVESVFGGQRRIRRRRYRTVKNNQRWTWTKVRRGRLLKLVQVVFGGLRQWSFGRYCTNKWPSVVVVVVWLFLCTWYSWNLIAVRVLTTSVCIFVCVVVFYVIRGFRAFFYYLCVCVFFYICCNTKRDQTKIYNLPFHLYEEFRRRLLWSGLSVSRQAVFNQVKKVVFYTLAKAI